MKTLVVMVAMTVAVTAYKDRRNSALSALEDYPPYQETRHRLPFHEQHQPFREASFNSQQYQSYRHRPYRQDLSSSPEQLSFRDHSSLRDYSSSKTRPFYGDGSFFRDSSNFKGRSSYLSDGTSDNDQPRLNNDQILQDQPFTDRYSYQRPVFRDDYRVADLYDKPINSYREQQIEGYVTGNHDRGYISVPPISSYGNAFPLNDGTSTTMTPLMVSTTQQSTVSSLAPAITQVHTFVTSEPKMASTKASHTVTMPTVKSDTKTEVSDNATITKTGSSVNEKQSSNLAESNMALTTEASLPVITTDAPIVSYDVRTLSPIEFPAGKFTAPSSYYFSSGLKNKLQQSLLDYLLSQQAKSPLKINEQTSLSNYLFPDVSSNSLDSKIPSSTVNNYVLPTLSKGSLLNYLLQQESSSSTGALNYLPLTALAEKPKYTLPTVPLSTLSAIPRPLQTFNYQPVTLPKISTYGTSDSSLSSVLPLGGSALPTSLSSVNVADSQATNVFHGIPASINGGINGGIAAGIPAGIPAGISTLNLAPNFQHLGQTRQFEPLKSHSYSPGLQLQLGGFSGIDYTLRSPNPGPRPLDLGIAKVGLSLPELPRHQLSTLSKVALGHQLW